MTTVIISALVVFALLPQHRMWRADWRGAAILDIWALALLIKVTH